MNLRIADSAGLVSVLHRVIAKNGTPGLRHTPNGRHQGW